MPTVKGSVSLTPNNRYRAELKNAPECGPNEIIGDSKDDVQERIDYHLKAWSYIYNEKYTAQILEDISYYERLPDDIEFFGWIHYRLEELGGLVGLVYLIGVLAFSFTGMGNEQEIFFIGIIIVSFLVLLRLWWFVFFQFKEQPENVTVNKLGVLRVD